MRPAAHWLCLWGMLLLMAVQAGAEQLIPDRPGGGDGPDVVEPGTITRQVGHIIDVMATCVELAGTEYPDTFDGNQILPLEGKSLVPVFESQERIGHETLCWEFTGNRAVRQGKWKLVWDKLVKRWELYDLEADRTETNDLAAEDPDRVAQMAEVWFAWAAKTGLRVKR